MKGYKFTVEFVVWGKKNRDIAKDGLADFLLKAGDEEGFNVKLPEFVGEVKDPMEELKKDKVKRDRLGEKGGEQINGKSEN